MRLTSLIVSLCAAVFPALAQTPVAPRARLDNAKVFPFFAAGGGWESTVILVNVADADTDYRIRFYGPNGQPAVVSYRDRLSRLISADTIAGTLKDDGGDVFVLADFGALQTGWAQLEYSGDDKISGQVVFRQRVLNRPDYEASSALARGDETRLWFPFDNTSGFATTLAITNPSATDSTTLQVRFWDYSGSEITTRQIQMGAGTTLSFSLQDRFPELAGRSGQGRIESSGSRLAVISLRFNPNGPFTAVPVVSH